MRGIDPRASHMLSERSTTWATPPILNQLLIIAILLDCHLKTILEFFLIYTK